MGTEKRGLVKSPFFLFRKNIGEVSAVVVEIGFLTGGRPMVASAVRKVHLAIFAQTKGSLVQRELARERLRDCKSVEIAEQKRKR